MNLYRSTTPTGLLWTGTQADAKEAQGGKDFEHIEVPTDKPSLIAFLNAMENRVAAGVPVPILYSDNYEPEALDDEEAPVRTVAAPVATLDPASCPACLRSNRVSKIVSTSEATVSIRSDLEDIHTMDGIDRIIAMANGRKSAILLAGDPEQGDLEAA